MGQVPHGAAHEPGSGLGSDARSSDPASMLDAVDAGKSTGDAAGAGWVPARTSQAIGDAAESFAALDEAGTSNAASVQDPAMTSETPGPAAQANAGDEDGSDCGFR
jgi:hypothetical protein